MKNTNRFCQILVWVTRIFFTEDLFLLTTPEKSASCWKISKIGQKARIGKNRLDWAIFGQKMRPDRPYKTSKIRSFLHPRPTKRRKIQGVLHPRLTKRRNIRGVLHPRFTKHHKIQCVLHPRLTKRRRIQDFLHHGLTKSSKIRDFLQGQPPEQPLKYSATRLSLICSKCAF